MTDAATITAPTVMGRERREKSREVRSTGARNRTIKRMLIGGVLAYIIQLSFCVDHCVFPNCFIGVTATHGTDAMFSDNSSYATTNHDGTDAMFSDNSSYATTNHDDLFSDNSSYGTTNYDLPAVTVTEDGTKNVVFDFFMAMLILAPIMLLLWSFFKNPATVLSRILSTLRRYSAASSNQHLRRPYRPDVVFQNGVGDAQALTYNDSPPYESLVPPPTYDEAFPPPTYDEAFPPPDYCLVGVPSPDHVENDSSQDNPR
eukprot:GHVQ01040411.1.p1 GENE.GHVQ01040411.1~~GHVQ01040411.1.p1  ORF type:complete len:259 (+),score=38.92 GHVQ01040411.1:138-914(+)